MTQGITIAWCTQSRSAMQNKVLLHCHCQAIKIPSQSSLPSVFNFYVYPSSLFSRSKSPSAASAITVPGGKIAATPALLSAS